MDLIPWTTRKEEQEFIKKFEFWMFSKSDFYCIDGFPTEGMPGVMVLPAPMRTGYVYQGLKPAVIVFNQDNLDDPDLFDPADKESVMEIIKKRQEEQQAKLKEKRALSAMPERAERAKTLAPKMKTELEEKGESEKQ